jgi:xylose isomerase
MIQEKKFDDFIRKRYAAWGAGLGKKIDTGRVGFEELEAFVLEHGEPEAQSGRQEMLENFFNEYI